MIYSLRNSRFLIIFLTTDHIICFLFTKNVALHSYIQLFWEFHANRINAPIYRFENKLYFCRQVGYMSPFCHRWYFLRVGLLVVTFFSVMY